jgi:hypothetical protein
VTISLQSSKMEVVLHNQYGHVIHRSGILHKVRKSILLGVKKEKISLQSPKTYIIEMKNEPAVSQFNKSKINFHTKRIKTSNHKYSYDDTKLFGFGLLACFLPLSPTKTFLTCIFLKCLLVMFPSKTRN